MWKPVWRLKLCTSVYSCKIQVNYCIKTHTTTNSVEEKTSHVYNCTFKKWHYSIPSLNLQKYELLGKNSLNGKSNRCDSVLDTRFLESCQITEIALLDSFNICDAIGEVFRNFCHHQIYCRGMSLNKLTIQPDIIEEVVDDDDSDEVCIVFEKIIQNKPAQGGSKKDEDMNNESKREDTLQCGSSSKDFKTFLKKSTTECVNSPLQFVGNTSRFIDRSKVQRKKGQLRELRQWNYTNYGKDFIVGQKGEANSLPFTIMSYNVLSQSLLESHPYLYYNHDPAALYWEWRSKALLVEIEAASPDILCLQEVQESHLECFYYPELLKLGYNGLYKKRTGDKPDGVAIYYKTSVFSLEEYTSVEFMQPIMPVLNRDNVALIARFSSKVDPSLPPLCVATTHLLYNPKRMDVKLAQMQLLLAELERLAFVSDQASTTYHPLIITGDLNVTPKSSLYRLLTTGLLLDSDVTDEMHDVLGITNNCQHFSILTDRQSSGTYPNDRLSELRGLKMYNSDNVGAIRKMAVEMDHPESRPGLKVERKKGHLSHNFILKSAYEHRNSRGKEVTTKQDKWVTVDYIFYSCIARGLDMEPIEGKLKLISRQELLCKEECFAYGPIPNLSSPSDHFPLVCKFMLT